jgi:hypothetical protein
VNKLSMPHDGAAKRHQSMRQSSAYAEAAAAVVVARELLNHEPARILARVFHSAFICSKLIRLRRNFR